MFTISLAIGMIASGLATATPQSSTESKLSPADQQRTVCVPERTRTGRAKREMICKTGREWEIALAHAPTKRRDYASTTYLSYASYYKLSPWGPVARR